MSCTCQYGVEVKTVGRCRANLSCHWLHSIRSIQETEEYCAQHPFHHPRLLLEFKFCPKCGRELSVGSLALKLGAKESTHEQNPTYPENEGHHIKKVHEQVREKESDSLEGQVSRRAKPTRPPRDKETTVFPLDMISTPKEIEKAIQQDLD